MCRPLHRPTQKCFYPETLATRHNNDDSTCHGPRNPRGPNYRPPTTPTPSCTTPTKGRGSKSNTAKEVGSDIPIDDTSSMYDFYIELLNQDGYPYGKLRIIIDSAAHPSHCLYPTTQITNLTTPQHTRTATNASFPISETGTLSVQTDTGTLTLPAAVAADIPETLLSVKEIASTGRLVIFRSPYLVCPSVFK